MLFHMSKTVYSTQESVENIVKDHQQLLAGLSLPDEASKVMNGYGRANFDFTTLVNIRFEGSDLRWASFKCARLIGCTFCNVDLDHANFSGSQLLTCRISNSRCTHIRFRGAFLTNCSLGRGTDLNFANFHVAALANCNFIEAKLKDVRFEYSCMLNVCFEDSTGINRPIPTSLGVERSNFYWKKCPGNLTCNGYTYKLGLNKIGPNEVFADDPRIPCSFPGLHFSTKEWCDSHYPARDVLLKVRIPEEAKINDTYGGWGKASADMLEVVEIWLNGVDVTEDYKITHNDEDEVF